MKILRLLLFSECNRNCAGCCNKQWDLTTVPICQTYSGYDMIILTGGEPMLKPYLIKRVVTEIRKVNNCPIYLYTADVRKKEIVFDILDMIDGITLTLHEQSDVIPFLQFNKLFTDERRKGKSMRLNIFDEVTFDNQNASGWIIKSGIVWLDNCPLPDNEVFMRYD